MQYFTCFADALAFRGRSLVLRKARRILVFLVLKITRSPARSALFEYFVVSKIYMQSIRVNSSNAWFLFPYAPCLSWLKSHVKLKKANIQKEKG